MRYNTPSAQVTIPLSRCVAYIPAVVANRLVCLELPRAAIHEENEALGPDLINAGFAKATSKGFRLLSEPLHDLPHGIRDYIRGTRSSSRGGLRKIVEPHEPRSYFLHSSSVICFCIVSKYFSLCYPFLLYCCKNICSPLATRSTCCYNHCVAI
jgi:hypothetical protein